MFGIILTWDLFDSLAPKGLFYPSFISPLFAVAIFIYFMLSLVKTKGRLNANNSKLVLFMLLMLSITSINTVYYPNHNSYAILADLGTYVNFCLALLVAPFVFSSMTESTFKLSVYLVLGLSVILAMISASFDIFPIYYFNDRFDPPHPLLFTVISLMMMTKISSNRKYMYSGLYVLLFVVALSSGTRSVAVVAGISLILSFYIQSKNIKDNISLLIALAVMSTLLFYFVDNNLFSSFAEKSRYNLLADKLVDESLEGRIEEIKDILEYYINFDIFNMAFGAGFGGTWAPIRANPEINILKDGMIHYIHFTPAALLFRYGLVGLLFYIYIGSVLIRDLFSVGKNRIGHDFVLDALFICSILIYINSFMRTMFYDTSFLLIISGYFYLRNRKDFRVSVKGRKRLRINKKVGFG